MLLPRAVLVDLDDTLLDGAELPQAVAQTCTDLAAAGYGLDAGTLVDANAAVWARLWPDAERDWVVGRLTGASLRLNVWRETVRLAGCDDDAVARLASDTHASYVRRALRLSDGAADFIAMLAGRCSLGVVTNGAADDQRQKLAWFDLERRFDPIVISGEIGVAKPDPAIFAVALDRLSVRAADVWHVGDSLRADVAGAQAAGITAVWLNRAGDPPPPGQPQPDIETSSLTQLARLLEQRR